MKKREYVLWKDPKYPKLPPTWLPIDREKGIVVTGHLTCNKPPTDGQVIGEVRFSGEPIFSQPIVSFYELDIGGMVAG